MALLTAWHYLRMLACQAAGAHAANAAGRVAFQKAQAMPLRCGVEAHCSCWLQTPADAVQLAGGAVIACWGSADLKMRD